MRKLRRLLPLILAIAVFLAGCGPADDSETADYLTAGGDEMEKVEMTDTEIELLCKVYVTEDSIRQGMLFSAQKEALMMLRAGTTYLKEKYPWETFEILLISPVSLLDQKTTITFTGSAPGEYEVLVASENGGYTCTDTYYVALLKDRYDAKVESLLAESGLIVKASTMFTTPLGRDFDANATADDLIALGSGLIRITDLYMQEPAEQERAIAVRDKLQELGLYGTYTLFFTPSLDGSTEDLAAGQSEYIYASFVCGAQQ